MDSKLNVHAVLWFCRKICYALQGRLYTDEGSSFIAHSAIRAAISPRYTTQGEIVYRDELRAHRRAAHVLHNYHLTW